MPRILRAYTACRYGQLHYRFAEPDMPSSKPPLLLLHQNPSSSREYEKLILAMAEDRRVFAFDTPGNGMSDPPPAPPEDMAGYAVAFVEAMEKLGLGDDQPVDVFGYHSGSYHATELAITAPDRVGRVVLSGVPMRSAAERAANLAKAREVGLPREDGSDLFEQMRWLWTFVVEDRLPGVSLEEGLRTFIDKAAAADRRTWTYIGVWSYPAEERLPRVKQPVLIIQPDEPLLEQSRAAAALFPNARFVEVPELSRDVFEIGVASFAREMRAFLS